jgi:hypothetical protein
MSIRLYADVWDTFSVSVQPPHLPLAAAMAYSCPRQMAWTPIHFNFF